METLAVSLGVAIFVMLILLTSCWNSGSSFAGHCHRNNSYEGMQSGCNSVSVNKLADDATGDNTGQFWADTGTGLINQQLSSQYNDLQNLDSYQDWSQVSQYQALEPEVLASHQEYTHDINRSTTTASIYTIRSDDQYPVSFVGLRRPDLHSTYAADDARTTHTEVPSQMPSKTSYLI
jgi:hypothetical protein